MTDLDSTQIISADESLVQNSSIVETEAILKIVNGFESNTYHINKETIIGRAAPSDLIIPAPSLSKQHAKLTINNGQFFITDLGSSNKTYQNKVQLQANVCYALHEGDEIKLGDILCSYHEQKPNNHHNVNETKTETITTSQTINDSYDDAEPVQPMKIWNGNMKTNNVNHAKDSSTKSNGTTNQDEDGHLTITSTTLPEPSTSTTIDETKDEQSTETKMEETAAAMENPIVEEPPPMETSAPVDDVSSTTMETNAPAVCSDPVEPMENSSPRPASEQLEVVPVSKLVEQLQEVDDSTPKDQIEVTINQDLVKETIANDQMDTEETKSNENEMIIDEKPEETTEMIVNEEKTETTNPIQEEKPAEMIVDQSEKTTKEEIPTSTMEEEPSVPEPTKPSETVTEEKMDNTPPVTVTESTAAPAETEIKPVETDEPSKQEDEEEGEEEEEVEDDGAGDESSPHVSARPKRGLPRKNARRARGRRAAAARARVVSTKIHGTRRQAHPVVTTTNDEDNNVTLEETVNKEPEESPEKSKPVTPATPEVKETRSKRTTTKEQKKEATPPPPATTTSAEVEPTPATTTSTSTVRTSARIKERASTGRNRQFPYTDDYVDLDDLEKQSKANQSKPSSSITPNRKSSGRERASKSPPKRANLRQQPVESSKSPTKEEKVDVYDQMDTIPEINTSSNARKRKSVTTPVTTNAANKRSRATTPQTAPSSNNRRKGTSPAAAVESSPTVSKSTRRSAANPSASTTTHTPPPPPPTTTTPKRASRKSTKSTPIKEETKEKSPVAQDRPVRIALSSHLNFNPGHLEVLRGLGFEIMDESCQVDALVVDRIRRTKKFFMCLARGAHILSPTWIETMIKDKTYLPYEKFYLEDTNAETRYGFQLRESVRLAKQRPIFANYKFFCTKDTSPPYEDLKDIIEAAGGNLIDKYNANKPGKDLICIVGQNHKSEFEDLFRKGVPIVSEEFILSGISKQKLDFDSFSLFQNATTVKSTGK